MIDRLKPKSEFSRNVLTLMTGTTIAQAIPIVISPVLTRIYTPEDFGVFALYMSLVSMLSVAATGRYELAIMLPKKDTDAMNIVALSVMLSCIAGSIILAVVFFFNSQIVNLLGNPKISTWLYFVPFAVFLSGAYHGLNYWANRNKQYKELAKNRVIQSGTTATVNLGMGFSGFGGGGLILSSVFGQGIATANLAKSIFSRKTKVLRSIKRVKIHAVAKRYIKFPKFDIPASLLSIFSDQITYILFNALFSATIAGYYYLTQRILGLPIAFIASAVSDVFREEASQNYRKHGNAKKIYIETFKKLALLGIMPSVILYFFAADLFEMIFGQEWRKAGEYVQILTPMFFVKFIASPLSFMVYIAEKQKLNMHVQLLFAVSVLFSFLMNDDTEGVLGSITLLFSSVYVYYIYISAKIAKVL